MQIKQTYANLYHFILEAPEFGFTLMQKYFIWSTDLKPSFSMQALAQPCSPHSLL